MVMGSLLQSMISAPLLIIKPNEMATVTCPIEMIINNKNEWIHGYGSWSWMIWWFPWVIKDGIDDDHEGHQDGSSRALRVIMMPMFLKMAPWSPGEREPAPERNRAMSWLYLLIYFHITSQIITYVSNALDCVSKGGTTRRSSRVKEFRPAVVI